MQYTLQIHYTDRSTKTLVSGDRHALPGVRTCFKEVMRKGGCARLGERTSGDSVSVDKAVVLLMKVNNALLAARQDIEDFSYLPGAEGEYRETVAHHVSLYNTYKVLAKAIDIMQDSKINPLRPDRLVLHAAH